jgi:hypothetical protein
MTTNRLSMCEQALKQIEEYDHRFPGEPALISVAHQLQYIMRAERGEGADRSRLSELTMGRLAVYELSNIISDDLSKLLCTIADDVRREVRRVARHETKEPFKPED